MRGRIIAILALVLAVAGGAQGQTLQWDPSPDSTVAGYTVSIGNKPGVYTTTVDVGKQTSYALQNLDASLNYYFAVRAYNAQGLFSSYSNEVGLPAAAPPGTTVIKSLVSSAAYPLLIGAPVTWTASGSSKLGPVEYSFWMYSASTGWVSAQDYSSNPSFTWTPGWADRGTHAIQVWARTVGSTAKYEAWVGTEFFDVNGKPLQLTASTEFPVPPGQPVTWTADVAGAPAGTALEYQFWVYRQSKGTWTSMGAYGASNELTWTPTAVDTYAVQAWARQVGSTANYDVYASSGFFNVAKGPLTVTSLAADTALPAATGTTITWVARARGGNAGPLQYAFYRYKNGEGWTKVQDYSTSNSYTWTPTWGDEGSYAIQVWARSAGATANYEGWLGTPMFDITRASVQLTTPTMFPVAPGTPVKFTAGVSDPSVNVEYSFWLYNQATGTWSNPRAYSTTPTFTWTPSATGKYAVQVWVRRVGVTDNYELWRGTDILDVSMTTSTKVISLAASETLPVAAGTPITWTANAVGGSARLQYKFWVYDGTSWTVGQNYSTSNTFNWTPPSAGTYAVQVWVRSTGNSANYEDWSTSGLFSIR
jgi:hypothetical protein